MATLSPDAARALRAAVGMVNADAGPDDVRARLRGMLCGNPDQVAVLANATLSAAGARPQLMRRNGSGWQLEMVPTAATPADCVLVDTAWALAELVVCGELTRLSQCAGTGCHRLVLDLSRNRSRRYCSVACSNRYAVARYRSRTR